MACFTFFYLDNGKHQIITLFVVVLPKPVQSCAIASALCAHVVFSVLIVAVPHVMANSNVKIFLMCI